MLVYMQMYMLMCHIQEQHARRGLKPWIWANIDPAFMARRRGPLPGLLPPQPSPEQYRRSYNILAYVPACPLPVCVSA